MLLVMGWRVKTTFRSFPVFENNCLIKTGNLFLHPNYTMLQDWVLVENVARVRRHDPQKDQLNCYLSIIWIKIQSCSLKKYRRLVTNCRLNSWTFTVCIIHEKTSMLSYFILQLPRRFLGSLYISYRTAIAWVFFLNSIQFGLVI